MSEHGGARAVGNRLRIRARHGWIARVVEQDEFDQEGRSVCSAC
jgi:hypothetical protein